MTVCSGSTLASAELRLKWNGFISRFSDELAGAMFHETENPDSQTKRNEKRSATLHPPPRWLFVGPQAGAGVLLVCLLALVGCAFAAPAAKSKEGQTPTVSATGNVLHFHAAFDGTRTAVVDGRKTTPLNQANYEYEDGPVGKAIVIDKDAVVYREENSFPLKQGTVMFWLKPHWQPRSGRHHWPFKKWSGWRIGPLDGGWFLFGGGGSLTAGLSPTSGSGSALHWFYEPQWKQGQWKHVAVTWGKQGAHYYINGCLVDTTNRRQCFPEKHAGKFYLGGKHNYYSGKMSMDDLRVYREPLSRKQVRVLLALGDAKFATAAPTVHRDKWTSIRPPAKFAHLPKDSYTAWPAHTYRIFTGMSRVAEDEGSETGIAIRTELSDKGLAGLDGNVLKWDIHDHAKKATGKEATIKYLKLADIVPGTGYHWYKLGTYQITENNFIWMYGISLAIELGDARDSLNPAGEYDIWARIRFEGPAFRGAAKLEKNAISIEWVVAVIRSGD